MEFAYGHAGLPTVRAGRATANLAFRRALERPIEERERQRSESAASELGRVQLEPDRSEQGHSQPEFVPGTASSSKLK